MDDRKNMTSVQKKWRPRDDDNSKKISSELDRFAEWVIKYRIDFLCEKAKNEGVQEGYQFALCEILDALKIPHFDDEEPSVEMIVDLIVNEKIIQFLHENGEDNDE